MDQERVLVVYLASGFTVASINVSGLPMTAGFDLIAIVQDGKGKATNAYHVIRPFLTRKHFQPLSEIRWYETC